MGYGGTKQRNPHRWIRRPGIDGVIDQDPLWLNQIHVQGICYAHDKTLGCPEIQVFVGALHGEGVAHRGFITSSRFS
ncbi:restriction endonuclease [Rhodococcus erythropolis]